EQVAAEVAKLVAARDEVCHDGEHVRRLLLGDRARHARQKLGRREPERGLNVRRANLPLAETYHLIEGRLRVAHRALARARYLAQRVFVYLYLLGVGYVLQAFGNLRRRDGSELELLAARKYRLGNLMRVRRRHDEEHARRRLLQGL